MENSKIEWTDHTFNPWHGCMKVSEGCKNCYAETLDNRWNGNHWGPNAPRKPMSEAYWNKPLIWDKSAAKSGVKAKVFCASMADVFEDHADVVEWRKRLFLLIDATPNLIWQVLTKRPENIMKFVPSYWGNRFFPDNLWIGTSVENQKAADERIPHLIKVPAKVRFLSCEPLLGPIEFSDVSRRSDCVSMLGKPALFGIHWVIAGGESGHHARPMHPNWAISLRDQCKAANVPLFFKQWGEWYTKFIKMTDQSATFKMWNSYQHFTQKLWAGKGDTCISLDGKICEIGKHFMEAKYPVAIMQKVGKKNAGSLLEGQEWKEFPI